MIPASPLFDQSVMAALLNHDPVVCEHRAFFALLDWSVLDQWQATLTYLIINVRALERARSINRGLLQMN